jgi:prepilin-type N-terminal cleavage/methylation domain-containing protein
LKTKGFTLIELLVVIVIIGILVAIALPNFIKIKDKAKEAETKQNLHSIQLAVERYATDMSGNYPFFLMGGDSLINFGTANAFFESGYCYFNGSIYHPFDAFCYTLDDSAWTYDDGDPNAVLAGDVEAGWGDTLQYEAYMTKYPRNPFVIGDAAKQFGTEYFDTSNLNNFSGWGGAKGDLMFNVGPWGEVPQLIRLDDGEEEVYNDMPGQFYYHPRWADGITNYGHNVNQYTAVGGETIVPATLLTPIPLDDSAEVSSLDVAGYDLAAIGAARTKGQDIDNAVTLFGHDKFRTGYFTLGQERNPYVQAGDYGDNGDYEERPFSDGRYDFFIIHLSSGIDRKIQDFSKEG